MITPEMQVVAADLSADYRKAGKRRGRRLRRRMDYEYRRGFIAGQSGEPIVLVKGDRYEEMAYLAGCTVGSMFQQDLTPGHGP